MTLFTNSIQQVSVTIAAGATTGTATISSVGSNAFLIWQGKTETKAASTPLNNLARVDLTNPTTVTATRNTSDATNSVTVNAVVIDPTVNLVTAIQAGTITITAGTTNTATISSVDTTLSAVFYLGESTTSATSYASSFSGVTLTNATTVTATIGATGTTTLSYVVVTFAASAIKSIQQVSDLLTQAVATTDTKTITSVVTANSMIAFGGFQESSGNVSTAGEWITLTNSTTVTLTRNAAGASSRTYYYTVIEFTQGVLQSAQRGSIDLASVTSNTATIFPKVSLTNSTTVTATKNTAGVTTLTSGYEVIEFANVAGISFDVAGNSADQAAASSYSGSATWNGINRLLAIDVSLLGPGVTVTAMTYGGAACTFVGAISTVTSFGRIEQWRIKSSDSGAPAAGSNTLSVTLSGSLEFSVEWVSYIGVHQTSPTESFNSNQATNVGSATDASVVVTPTSDNCWIHAAIAANDNSIVANQTTRNNISGTLGSGANEDNNAAVTPAAATTMSYSGMGITTTWAMAGYALRPVTDAALVTNTFRKTLSGIGTRTGSRQVMNG